MSNPTNPTPPRDPAWPQVGYVKAHVTRTSTVRSRSVSTSRVAASITMSGRQDVRVRVIPGRDGGQVVAVRIGTLLIYLEDSEALTELIEAAAAAHHAGNQVFGSDNPEARARRTRAWQALHRSRRTDPA